MSAALNIIEELGVENIQKHNHQLIDKLISHLNETDYFKITSSLVAAERSSILTFTCDDYSELHKVLIENKCYCAHREGSIRIAVHLFNNENDIDKLIDALKEYRKQKSGSLAARTN